MPIKPIKRLGWLIQKRCKQRWSKITNYTKNNVAYCHIILMLLNGLLLIYFDFLLDIDYSIF